MEDIYCKVCGGCGEDGCCPAEICEHKEGGLYCEKYLMDLKFHSLMFKDTYDILNENHKCELNRIYDENWDKIYNKK